MAELAASLAAGTLSIDDLHAQLSAGADAADRRPTLWFAVIKPMTTSATGRETVHLRAFHEYSAHTQDVVLAEAYTTTDPSMQRTAIADWLYWKHLTDLLQAAILVDAPAPRRG
jgi:hypothetical protein